MPSSNFLSRLAGVAFCVFVGFVLAVLFQFECHLTYNHQDSHMFSTEANGLLYQKSTTFDVTMRPWYTPPALDFFGHGSDK
jgi:hypothetical protein